MAGGRRLSDHRGSGWAGADLCQGDSGAGEGIDGDPDGALAVERREAGGAWGTGEAGWAGCVPAGGCCGCGGCLGADSGDRRFVWWSARDRAQRGGSARRLCVEEDSGGSVGDFAPKVAGVVNLDAATRAVGLEFMILFGSGSGVFGNVGQADYAAANGFLDSCASYRNGLVKKGDRDGLTLSVDWPLWRDGGMKMDAAVAGLRQ